jgi:hypothetical protein
MLSRRGLISSALASIPAAALRPLLAAVPALGGMYNVLTMRTVYREAFMLFASSNPFLQAIDKQYEEEFGREGAKIGTTLRIRLPNSYEVRDV